MTKSDLIADLAASNPHLRQADVELIVSTIFDQITAALARGARVELRGFDVFAVKRRDARMGHNPRTGEPVSVAAKAVPFFKAGKNCTAGSIAQRDEAPSLRPAAGSLVPAQARRNGRLCNHSSRLWAHIFWTRRRRMAARWA